MNFKFQFLGATRLDLSENATACGRMAIRFKHVSLFPGLRDDATTPATEFGDNR